MGRTLLQTRVQNHLGSLQNFFGFDSVRVDMNNPGVRLWDQLQIHLKRLAVGLGRSFLDIELQSEWAKVKNISYI
jgi:hypothetical protein